MILTEFLLARIAEDEAEAEDCRPEPPEDPNGEPSQYGKYGKARGNFHQIGCYYYSNSYDPPTCDCDGWKRRLAECEAKRKIVELSICTACAVEYQPCDHRDATLRLLALMYATHPDYREEWRP